MPLALALSLHKAIGLVIYRCSRRSRSTVLRNLGLSFPELSSRQVDSLARRYFAALGASVAETATAWCGSERHLEGRFEVVGLEHLNEALARGKGAILYTGHFTGLEICGRPLKARLPYFVCMFSHRSNPLMEEIQRRGRARCAHESIASDQVRSLLGCLKKNAAVWYAPDQAPLASGATLIPFFAEPAMVNTSTSRLARISGAAVLPFAYRRIDGEARYVLEILPPLEDFPSDDVVADTRRLTKLLEQFVRAAPEQYFWSLKKFRGRPGLPDPYGRNPTSTADAPLPKQP